MVYLSRPYPSKIFKGCLPQNLPSLLLNTLSHIRIKVKKSSKFEQKQKTLMISVFSYFLTAITSFISGRKTGH